ncbi:MAG: phosphoglycerate dehydrogenase, partial [Marinilabiliales bacterium]
KKKDIQCFNSPEGNSISVAEHSTGLLFALLNNIVKSSIEIQNGLWHRNENWGVQLQDKNIGIIGFGHTGSAFAKRLTLFQAQIFAHDKYKNNFGSNTIKESTLEEVYDSANIVSVHIPYSEENHYYIDEQFINRMRKPFFLMNTSRGKIVKTSALFKAIDQGKILGAALDVFEYEGIDFESLSDNPVWDKLHKYISNGKIILTPHVAGWTKESYENHSKILSEKIVNYFGVQG